MLALGLQQFKDITTQTPSTNSTVGLRTPPTHEQEPGPDKANDASKYTDVDRPPGSRSHLDYRQRFEDQELLEQGKFRDCVLNYVFIAFPKLCSVVYTDWRGLARSGETYNECAFRLFGNTLAPDFAVQHSRRP